MNLSVLRQMLTLARSSGKRGFLCILNLDAHGKDYTLCGSRSGANAVGVWMILQAYGSAGGTTFVQALLARTGQLCAGLDRLGVAYFREPGMNVVTMHAKHIPAEVAARFGLVPDRHIGPPCFWKAVVMDHVDEDTIERFLVALT